MADFKPDTVIALGGGSAMDAAKGMWMFYEHPDTSFFGAKQNSWISVNGHKIDKPEKHNSYVSRQHQGLVLK